MKASFNFSDQNAHLNFYILSDAGEPAYNFECHKGDLDKNYQNSGDFAGFFQCKLMPAYEDDIDLFIPGGNWEGRFTRATFQTGWKDSCEHDPYYGLSRTFTLRNLKIVMTLIPISHSPSMKALLQRNLDAPQHYSFKFRVNVVQDDEAKNERALPSPLVCLARFYLDEKGNLREKTLRYAEN